MTTQKYSKMAKFFYDPSKLTEEQAKQLEEIRNACEVSQDEEIGLRMSEYIQSGKYKADCEKSLGKQI